MSNILLSFFLLMKCALKMSEDELVKFLEKEQLLRGVYAKAADISCFCFFCRYNVDMGSFCSSEILDIKL